MQSTTPHSPLRIPHYSGPLPYSALHYRPHHTSFTCALSTAPKEPNPVPPVLSVRDLHVTFRLDQGTAPAVRGVSFDIGAQQTLGIVGESGCGKSVTMLTVMRLLAQPPAFVDRGEALFGGADLLTIPDRDMRHIRGRDIAMVFQDPMTSLNPVFTCGAQIAEAVRLHRTADAAQAREIVQDMLQRVGIRDPGRTAAGYPHQMSGGMRQRVMIAMALSCRPQLLIADEPTTALDVTVQARILDLLKDLQQSMQMSMILISHDLGIVSDIAQQVIVMYAGQVVEQATVQQLFATPLHPYTKALLETIPSVQKKRDRLTVIPGEVPNPLHLPGGCAFHPRCSRAMDRCRSECPQLSQKSTDHPVRCFLYD